MRLLITGITGFVGSHMAEYALARGAEVIGSTRWRSRTENIEHLRGKIRLIECDLRDTASVRRLLAASTPTHVIHLAAQSFVGASWHTPAETLSTNIIGQVNLLEGSARSRHRRDSWSSGRAKSMDLSIRTSCRSGRRTPCALCHRTR